MAATSGYLLDIDDRSAVVTRPGGAQSSQLGDRLPLQFDPDVIDRSVGATYAAQIVVGASHRSLQWVAGGEHSWKFLLRLVLDGQSDTFVQDRLRWLESMTKATYDDGKLIRGPHRLLFVFGDLIIGAKGQKGAICVLQGPLTYKMKGPFVSDSKQVRFADVDIHLEEQVDEPVDYRDVRP